MDYSLISNHMVFDIDEVLEIFDEYIEELILLEHYFEDQLIESSIIFLEDVEVEYDPGECGKYFKQKYLKSEQDDHEFLYLLRNNFATGLLINGSLEIEIQSGRVVCILGNRGELILRTGLDSYVFSPLFKLNIQPEKAHVLLDALIVVFKNNHEEITGDKINIELFSMISGVCLMAMAKINELPVNNYEVNLSHDEMLLFGLALNLAGEHGDKETKSVIRSIMEQIKTYFPEIEHISPESFEPQQKMGQILDFKKPGDNN
ncbi:MAG: hypothetical protein PHS52_00175 [Desulfotomaculaceae bacterium]|nr:hypothetical protein [Desulfotomaculaceae bacterium]